LATLHWIISNFSAEFWTLRGAAVSGEHDGQVGAVLLVSGWTGICLLTLFYFENPAWQLQSQPCRPGSHNFEQLLTLGCPWKGNSVPIDQKYQFIYLNLPFSMMQTSFRCCIYNTNENEMKFSTPQRLWFIGFIVKMASKNLKNSNCSNLP
jgi:hypothetical protein